MTAVATVAQSVVEAQWRLCPGCRAVTFDGRLRRRLWVCPDCGRHLPLTVDQRLATLLDDGSVEPVADPPPDTDPLAFVDTVAYPQRRAEARRRTGLAEAAVAVSGRIHGHPVIVAAMDFRFLGGSLGAAVGELITRAGEVALARRVPLLLVTASGGARMQEGVVSLMQMAKTSHLMARLDRAGILTVSLVTDPTFGGVAASFATLADVIVAEPGARLGFAGPRVIAQTLREPLPAGFQTAEFLRDHGLIDLVCPRGELRALLGRLLDVGRPRGRARPDLALADVVVTEHSALPARDAWESVRRARDIARPTTADYLARVFDDLVELHGDRLDRDCPAVVGGLARLDGRSVVVLGTQKGHTATDLAAHNYGMGSPAGYRKAARLMRLAAKLGIPVVTLVDTPGAYPGLEAEQRGQAFAIADNLRLMAELPVPVVAVVTGEGGSGGALALAVADRVLMFEHAVYSVISPEGCAAILFSDAAQAPRAAAALRVGAANLLRLGMVDGVIPEPAGGAQADHPTAAERLKAALVAAVAEVAAIPAGERQRRRQERYRHSGVARGARTRPITVSAWS